MRVLLVGATGVIGSAIQAALTGHEVVTASRSNGQYQVDISDPGSIKNLFQNVGRVDAVISAAGAARFRPLANLSDDDVAFSLANKLMGQVNLVRYGVGHVNDGGSFTLTSGVLAHKPMPGAAALTLVNCGLQGFALAAALELPRGIRINVISPGWVTETLEAMGMDHSKGIPAAQVAKVYVSALTGHQTGKIIPAEI